MPLTASERSMRYARAHREKVRARQARWRDQNRDHVNLYTRQWKARNSRRWSAYIGPYNAEFRRKLRVEVLTVYSKGTPKCACCGWEPRTPGEIRFLHLDLVAGGHRRLMLRKEIPFGSNLLGWLKRKGYPKTWRVLCGGCNQMMPPGSKKCRMHDGAHP